MSSMSTKLRELLGRPGFVIAPGAYDPLTARLVHRAGFDAVYITGGGIARANAYPDMGLLTLSEVVDCLAKVVDAVEIPVIADMDSGYGNAVNVIRAVREFERVGVAGFHLEDQVNPKKCGHYEGKAVVPVEEMIGKIKAAVDTRRNFDTVVIARSDARAVEGLQAAIDRVNAYIEAGADVGFVEAPQTLDELAAIPKALNGPALVNVFEGGKTPVLPATELEALGFKLGIYPSQTQRAAIRAVADVLSVLKADGDTARIEANLATFSERETLIRTAEWRRREAIYVDNAIAP